jgi:hypothetical protein
MGSYGFEEAIAKLRLTLPPGAENGSRRLTGSEAIDFL